MKPPIKNLGRDISALSSKYDRVRKGLDKSDSSFTDALNKSVESIKEEPRETPKKMTKRSVRSVYAEHRNPTKFAQPRNITMLQAQRLAKLAPVIRDASAKYNVPVELICAVILQESGGNIRAKSHAGACGLMQLMPGTAKRFGVTNSFDPVQNINGGTAYLRFLLDRFKGNISLALAGYNAGEGNVEKYGNKIPPFKETQNYVPSVLGFAQSMVDILSAPKGEMLARADDLPAHARRV